jgi:glycosyltransferase involved in cell wall biosynthesis
MNIVILAPSASSFVYKFLPNFQKDDLPIGYEGAPFIGTLVKEFLIQNHRVTLITTTQSLNNDYSIKKFEHEKFTWIVVPSRPHSFRFNGKKIGRMLDFYSYEQKSMINAIKVINPDIVHAFWSYEFAGAASNSEFPFLVTICDNAFKVLFYFRNLYRLFRLMMSEIFLRKVKYASTVSPYMFEYVKNRCKYVNIIPNPIKIDIDSLALDNLINFKVASLSNPKLVMVFNGWDRRKNGFNGLLAFQEVQKIIPNASLHLYGSGTEINGPAFLEAQKKAIPNVHFNGIVSNEQLISSIKNAHLLIHPSLEESFGVVLIEAMSFGLPVIGGINSGAVPWVIGNEQMLVDVKDTKLFSAKILQLLLDEELYINLAQYSFNNVVDRYSSKSVASSYLDLYHHILKN